MKKIIIFISVLLFSCNTKISEKDPYINFLNEFDTEINIKDGLYICMNLKGCQECIDKTAKLLEKTKNSNKRINLVLYHDAKKDIDFFIQEQGLKNKFDVIYDTKLNYLNQPFYNDKPGFFFEFDKEKLKQDFSFDAYENFNELQDILLNLD